MLAPAPFRTIQVATDGAVATITLDRPERRNALSLELMRELTTALRAIGDDRSLRAVVLRANGPAFSSGHDLKELHDADVAATRRIFEVCVVLMETLQAISQPVIAQVQGVATAAGCQLVATCDLAVASDAATFATPGVKIGLFCTTPMVALSRTIGRKRALEMLYTGTPISAQTAAEWGLINRFVPGAVLDEEAHGLASRIASASGEIVGIGKQAFYRQIDLDAHAAYAYAKEVMTLNALDVDAREGIGAFLDKREARWTQR